MENISNTDTEKSIVKWVFCKYPHLSTRWGRPKNHVARSIMKENYIPYQHKGRRVSLHLLNKVEYEVKKLIDEKQIIKLDIYSDQHFISPVIIMVKKQKNRKSMALVISKTMLQDNNKQN